MEFWQQLPLGWGSILSCVIELHIKQQGHAVAGLTPPDSMLYSSVPEGSVLARNTIESKMQMLIRNRAFTLIELLIVVAIIAILAAIAVPNFLEAQTRSKVARTQSDMRSLATAIEAYRVDYNRYPLPVAVMNTSFAVIYPMPDFNHNVYAHNFPPQTLTTPVAYVTTLFVDVFADPALEPAPEQSYYYYQNWEYTAVLAEQAGASLMASQLVRANAFGSWILSANGPDRDRKDLAPGAVGPTNIINGVYDPTNGTVSNGDIIRTQRNPSGFTL